LTPKVCLKVGANLEANATKAALAEYLQNQHWDSFFTATFKTKQRYSATAIDRVTRAFTAEPLFRPTKMFIAAEQHMLGGWHCHGLLEYAPGTNPRALNDLHEPALRSLGFNKINQVGHVNAASIYLSKYLVKSDSCGDWRMTGRKKFWV
jgi:hypothetical protein